MARYRIRQDSGSTKTLLIAAGVLVGVLAGAAAAQRLGGWRGIVRRLKRGRGPLYDMLRDNISPQLVERWLSSGRDVIDLFASRPSRAERRRLRGFDAVLDEYEVEDYERAAAGLDLDEEDDAQDNGVRERGRRGARLVDAGDEEDDQASYDESVDASEIEHDVLRLFRRNRALRVRPIEIACDDDGVVELTGVVHSEREARAARRLAARVAGVSRVVLRLEVREPQAS